MFIVASRPDNKLFEQLMKDKFVLSERSSLVSLLLLQSKYCKFNLFFKLTSEMLLSLKYKWVSLMCFSISKVLKEQFEHFKSLKNGFLDRSRDESLLLWQYKFSKEVFLLRSRCVSWLSLQNKEFKAVFYLCLFEWDGCC